MTYHPCTAPLGFSTVIPGFIEDLSPPPMRKAKRLRTSTHTHTHTRTHRDRVRRLRHSMLSTQISLPAPMLTLG